MHKYICIHVLCLCVCITKRSEKTNMASCPKKIVGKRKRSAARNTRDEGMLLLRFQTIKSVDEIIMFDIRLLQKLIVYYI